MRSRLSFYLEKLKKIKREHLLVGALFGILLLVISIPTEKKETEDNSSVLQETENVLENEDKSSTYCRNLEKQLKRVLGAMDGVGKVEVMITLKDTGESIVEKDITRMEEKGTEKDGDGIKRENTNIDFQEETIYVQNTNHDSTPFITKEVRPQIEGVVVVAEGAQSAVVVKNISDAVLALFPIEMHKIKVVKMN